LSTGKAESEMPPQNFILTMSELISIDFASYANIVVLTGAGISVASGLPTFRGTGSIGECQKSVDFTFLTFTPSHTLRI